MVFLTDIGYRYVSRALSLLVQYHLDRFYVCLYYTKGKKHSVRRGKGASITSCLYADDVCHMQEMAGKSEAHSKLFPQFSHDVFSWYQGRCHEFETFYFGKFPHYLCSTRKLHYFAIIIKSCNDTGFHTPCVCANTTPLSIYSVTLPSEYKAFPSKRRLGIGINSRLFSSA